MKSRPANRAAGFVGFAVAMTIAVVALAAGFDDEVRVSDLSRDPATLSHSPAHVGLLTVLGGFVWSATIVVTVFGAWVLGAVDRTDRRVWFLRAAALLSTVLMIDDMFLIHERLAPDLGLAEEALFSFYGAAVVAFVVVFQTLLRSAAWPLLVGALAMFLVAVAHTRLIDVPAVLLPDTVTFLGIGLWCGFFVHTTVAWVEVLIKRPRSSAEVDGRSPIDER